VFAHHSAAPAYDNMEKMKLQLNVSNKQFTVVFVTLQFTPSFRSE